jgi:hypothetical protein
MAVPTGPAAFMSYARFNDQHDDGLLSQLRLRLAAEIRAQTGEEFAIFQDRSDIAWGQNWQERIDEALDAATLLLVIITPGLFRSRACRAEFQRFLERERMLGREDLILPVYYISAREMDDPGMRAADEMATVLASRQFADWRELRFEPFTAPLVRKAIALLASRMRDTFWRPPAAPPRRPTLGSPAERAGRTESADRPSVKAELPTLVAYQRGGAAATSAGEAMVDGETQVQAPQPHRPKVFLCYRREDTQGFARGIYQSLASKYGPEQVFRDVDSTPAGVRFSAWIESRVSQCSVMLVLIGNAWLSAEDHAGQRRLTLPKDWVRQEIEVALRRGIPIIPVRVQGAPMPSEDELPPSIADLTGFQSAEVTDSRWNFDVGLLIQAIDNLIATN